MFQQSGELLAEAGKAFVDFTNTTNHEERRIIYKTIKHAETKCDEITTQLFNALNDTFITPFDREDIRELADALDDVIDYINSSAKRIVLYQPETLPEQAAQLARIIRNGCEEIRLAMVDFSKLRYKSDSVMVRCSTMKMLEREADDVYEHFVIDLFRSEKDPVELFKLTQITKELERATNSVDNVGKMLKTIIIKYA